MKDVPTGEITVAGDIIGGTSVKNGFVDLIIGVPTVGHTITHPLSAQNGKERKTTTEKIIAPHHPGIHRMTRNIKNPSDKQRWSKY